MPRYLFEIEVDGSRFNGTQSQINGRAVQDELARAAATLNGGEATHVRPASRLDAGVDAERLPVDIAFARGWDAGRLGLALSGQLPADLSVRRVAPVADGFNAIRDAVGKTYRYRVAVRATRPVRDRRCLWVHDLPAADLLPAMCGLIIGRRDLSGFATLRHDGTDDDDPVREITAAAWCFEDAFDQRIATFRISGRGFLYRQVRGIVGAMIAVARGRRQLADFAAACAAGRDAVRVGNTAPAEGLTLERVAYDPDPAWALPSAAG
jgi:tRNA pseudouridine38-40 synthase